MLLLRLLDFPTFLLAGVIVDLEPFLVMVLGLSYPLHGFFHSFLGGSLAALALAVVMLKVRPWVSGVMSLLRLKQGISRGRILAASFLGVYVHLLLDSLLYAEMRPFYPFSGNPLLGRSLFIGLEVFWFCAVCFVAGVFVYTYRIVKGR